ncbi:MAG: hypothetical protein GY928_40055 [Colwellia sp.]|nr:hypothetical protein [Colwellia sp.]
MNNWADKAIEQVEADYEKGYISYSELNQQIKDIELEYEQEREDATQEFYNNY